MIKRLSKCVKGYTLNAILSPLFVMVEVVMDILIPFVMNFLLKDGVEKNNTKLILIYGGLLALMALTALLFGALSGVQASKASCGFAKNVRRDMYYKVQEYSFSNVDKFSPSSIITRMTTDVTFVQNSFQMIIRVAIRCPLMLIFALLMSWIVGGSLALVYVIVIPVLVCGLLLIFKFAHKIFKRLFKRYDKLNCVVEENIRAMRVVKSNVREEHETDKFEETSNLIFKEFSKAQKIIALNSPLMQLATYAAIIIIAYFGAELIVSTGETALLKTELQTLITYTSQILMSLMMLSMVFTTIIISRASAERICEILNEESDIKNPEKPCYSLSSGEIELKGVNFSYSNNLEKLALKNVNLKIESGETVGILGGTGSGKSSLVNLLPRLYDTTEGRVLVGGKDVREYDLETLRKSVAMVLQKNVLFSGTVKENLLWGKEDATDEEINEALRLACADEFVHALEQGINSRVEQGGANFSGGQKQRLCIARALIAKPKILILDDSTSAVDMNTDLKIRRAFKETIPETTKIIIAQRVASVMDCDKIVVMDGGKIVGLGSHDELLESCNIYSEVYNSQLGGGDFDED
ncbi:MAG: ABC transporter ATP-binding protein [Clostridia bacterium]|nr:ABC transporter ATP-binding protein [Clostridia bacterium]